MATRPRPAPPRDEIGVATELALLREILTRVEDKVDAIEALVDGHARQIDRWRTAGKIVAPVLVGLGAVLASATDDILMWLARAVKP